MFWARSKAEELVVMCAPATSENKRPALELGTLNVRTMLTGISDVSSWETIATDRDAWKLTLKRQLPKGESKWKEKVAEKRSRRKAKASENLISPSLFICPNCGRDCKARIGLLSHSRHCKS